MFLLRMSTLLEELRSGTVSSKKTIIFKMLYPIVLSINIALFAALIFGHHAINHFFKAILGDIKAHINFYYVWSYGAVLCTVVSALLGMLICYIVHKKYSDGLDFFRRFWMLSFAIRCHILFYAILALCLIGFYSNIHVNHSVTKFTKTIYPESKKTFTTKEIKTRRSYVVSAFRSPGALGFLPLLPDKIKTFFTDLREIILMVYQLMSVLPVFLTLLHYMVLAYYLKNSFGHKKTPSDITH